jgi:hypothetical protein
MMRMFLFPLFLFFTFSLSAQQPLLNNDEFSFVGLRVAELIERFGAPASVFSVRGSELWQDDVVFQYTEGDFYIYRDRVWMVKIASAHGINVGDPKPAALLVLGARAEDKGDHLLMPIPGGAWPLMFRVNINNTGRVSDIFFYRSDY